MFNIKTLLLNIILLIGSVSFSKEYYVTYTTSDDQNIVNPAIVKIQPINGDTINVRLITISGFELIKINGVLRTDNKIKLIGNKLIEGGYIYKHVGKLRGNIFLNTEDKKIFIIIIREK